MRSDRRHAACRGDAAARVPGLISRVDERGFHWLADARSPVLDRVLPALSRAADHSVLWISAAALLATLGGRRGRRAALRGLVSVGATSALVNGPLKLAWRRRRPHGVLPPRWVRQPRTFSFPSGHTASAFAFAAGAGAEMPGLRSLLAGLAVGVGWSRVRGRVHYPSDVLAGAGLGVAVGAAAGPVLALRRRAEGGRP